MIGFGFSAYLTYREIFSIARDLRVVREQRHPHDPARLPGRLALPARREPPERATAASRAVAARRDCRSSRAALAPKLHRLALRSPPCHRRDIRSEPHAQRRHERHDRGAQARRRARRRGAGRRWCARGSRDGIDRRLPAAGARRERADAGCAASPPHPRPTAPRARSDSRSSTLDELGELDIAIDGADQIDPRGWLIKGGGAAHTREKIVAAAARRFVVIASAEKAVTALNAPVPVEILRFAPHTTLDAIAPAQAARGAAQPGRQPDRRLPRRDRGPRGDCPPGCPPPPAWSSTACSRPSS